MKARPYQVRAIERVFELWLQGVKRVLLVLPTGGGKTVIASDVVRRCLDMQRRSIFLAHRRELIKQTHAKLCRNGLPVEGVGVVMAGVSGATLPLRAVPLEALSDDELWSTHGRRRPMAPIQVGSIDTFRNRLKPPGELVIVDEAHRALAKSYRDVQAAYPDAWHLGLTATPFRADGRGLEDAYDELVVASTFEELVEEGFLVAPRCYGTPRKVDLKGVRVSGGDYNVEDLAKAVDKAELVGDVVDHWLRMGNNAPTFVFACNVAHSKHLAERFNAAGVPALHVDGNTETNERDDAVRALRDGRVRVLCNCNVFSEGTDVPEVKTIVLARPTKSEGLFLQQAGRGARPCPGSPPFVILDHAGCCSDPAFGGLPQWPREYTLEGRKKRDKLTVTFPPTKDCPSCFAIIARAARKCDCGYEFPIEVVAPEPLTEQPGQLVDITHLTRVQVGRLVEWNAVVAEWQAVNAERDKNDEPLMKPGWVLATWRRRTRESWAPKGAKIPKLTPEQQARSDERRSRGKRGDEPIVNAPIVVHAPLGALEIWTL